MEREYYSLGNAELFNELETSTNGLSSAEAEERLLRFGLNEIAAKDRRTAISIMVSQVKSPLVLILVCASMVAAFLGDVAEAAIILAIVLINSALGFYQEYKSEKALAELKRYISYKAEVIRDGKKVEVDVREIVPGDFVFLNIGDIVPADIRLIYAQELSLNEAVVTGESLPVQKTGEPIAAADGEPSRQANVAFMGTVVSGGSGHGIVISTGKGTFFGKTATVLSAKEPQTDFQKNIRNFGNFLIKIIFLLTVFVFAANALLGKGVLESFLFALALAVGITPELLPIIITISLSAGALHLAKNKVVVKRLIAIEDLGNMDVLCMDKTGTLTENKIVLEDYFDVDGKKSEKVIELALVCNSANVEAGIALGNATDVAIWERAGERERKAVEAYKVIDELAFDYTRRRMGVVAETGGKTVLVCKGAPEQIIELCNSVQARSGEAPIRGYEERLKQKFGELSSRGFRVIAVAYREIGLKKEYSTGDEKNLVFSGFLVFRDPPKKTAVQAIKSFQNLGVELKILTGDNELVTKEVCREVGLEIKGNIVLGAEIEKMGESEFLKAVKDSNVFARITPEQKHRIVAGLGKLGHIVGFLGDGVNDAPALKAADCGITVDSAADVAKDSADIILLQKSLRVLAEGIREGRKTFGNITKYIFNTISANFGNMFSVAASSLFLKFIPLLPTQILLANLISDGPLMTISTDNVDEDYLHKPRRWNIRTISQFMVFFGAISMVFDMITMGVLMFIVGADSAVFRTAWFLESVLSEIIITFAIRTKRGFWKSSPSRLLVYSSVVGIALTVGLIYSPLAFLFEFEQLAVPVLAAIGIILLAYFVLAEITKKRFYARHAD